MHIRSIIVLVTGALGCISFPVCSQDNIFKDGDASVLKAKKAVVAIYSKASGYSEGYRKFNERRGGTGSGFFIGSRHIATCYHVVDHADKVFITLYDNREYEAKVVGYDEFIDAALLSPVDESVTAPDTLTFGDSDALAVTKRVIAVGNPGGLKHTFTSGIVSQIGRGNLGVNIIESYIQMDADINPGNSGGPLLSQECTVVGMNAAGSSSMKGLGFAVPSKMVQLSLRSLKKGERVIYPFVGVNAHEINRQFNDRYNITPASTAGLFIWAVADGSPAQTAGISFGDVVTAADQKPVRFYLDLFRALEEKKAGDTVTLAVERKSGRTNITLAVTERPKATPLSYRDYFRIYWDFETEKNVSGGAPVYSVGKIYMEERDKDKRSIQQGDVITSLIPGRPYGVQETVIDDIQMNSIIDLSNIDDGKLIGLSIGIRSPSDNEIKYFYRTKSSRTMFF
ncbi:MAG: trypsin-like peptidase domain-containing protein [Spirochaetes bacterium]|nr:trypsin-like peptidase domain-containing protein [Spirochaetota bacterium]